MTKQEDITDQDCNHHWFIESPNGPTSQGVCRLCGAIGQFKNSMPLSGWDRSNSHNRKVKPTRP